MQRRQVVAHLVRLPQAVANGINGIHRIEQPIDVERVAQMRWRAADSGFTIG